MPDKLRKDIVDLVKSKLGKDNPSDEEILLFLTKELQDSAVTKKELVTVKERIDTFNEIAIGMSGWDFSRKAPVNASNDYLDVLGTALNMFMEELKSSAVSVLHLQDVINCVPEMIFVLDKDYNITEVNKAVHTILHKMDTNIIGQNILDLVTERDLLKGLLQNRFINEEFTFLNRLHDEVPTTVHVERLQNRFREDGFVLVAVDQRINKSREKTLIKEKRRAEELTQAKAEFLSVMSHEIRTPLNAVIGLSEILENNEPRPDQVEMIKTLKFSGENLSSLINDILDYSKIEAGKVVLESIPIDLNEILKNVYKSLLFKAKENQNEIVLNIPDQLPMVYGDRVRIVQILTNLIGNSVKFTKSGKVVVSVVQLDKVGECVKISFSVMDTGVGIEQNKLDHIFDEFSQAESGTTRKYGGTGLGLTITKNLVKLHDSEINVKSEVGVGTNFYFDIEFEIYHGNEERAKEQVTLESLENKKVLLAEDNAVNVMVAGIFLEQLNVTYDVVENGEEALKLAQLNNYDVILMDLQMPVLDGFEAAKKIIAQDIKTPIIALTASALIEDQLQATEAGMVDFISKPFKSEELKSKLLKYS